MLWTGLSMDGGIIEGSLIIAGGREEQKKVVYDAANPRT